MIKQVNDPKRWFSKNVQGSPLQEMCKVKTVFIIMLRYCASFSHECTVDFSTGYMMTSSL